MNSKLEKLINAYKNETERKCYQINLLCRYIYIR